VGVQGVEEGAQDAALGGSCVEDQGVRGDGAHPHHLSPIQQEVQDPAAQVGVEAQVSEFWRGQWC